MSFGEGLATDIARVRGRLRATGRGKHVGSFSYYHVDLVRTVPDASRVLSELADRMAGQSPAYNVVKLGQQLRLSFLRYEDFNASFPVLLTALSCCLHTGFVRWIDYRERRNPPILHRKELLLPADDPRVGPGAVLTRQLEEAGAFANPHRIGTRCQWAETLGRIGWTQEEVRTTT